MCSYQPCSLVGLSISCFPSSACTQIPVACSPTCPSPCCRCFCPCRPPTARPDVPAAKCILPPSYCRPTCVSTAPPPAIRSCCCKVLPSGGGCSQLPCPSCPRY